MPNSPNPGAASILSLKFNKHAAEFGDEMRLRFGGSDDRDLGPFDWLPERPGWERILGRARIVALGPGQASGGHDSS